MAENRIILQGYARYLRLLREAPKAVQSEIARVIKDAADVWEGKAKASAPTDQGRLKQSITNNAIPGGYEVFVNVDYAPYMEWGTKTKVNVPVELKGYASQFKGRKGGGQAKRAIYDWCKRVGVPPERWWLVYVHIMRYGVKPQPFFFIHRASVTKQLLGDLQQLVDSL